MTAPGAAITVATNIQDTATFARREAAPAPAAATPSRPWTLPRPRRVAVLGGNCVMADHRAAAVSSVSIGAMSG